MEIVMHKLTIGEQLFYSTIKLTSAKGGNKTGTGTGFFFSFPKGENQRIPSIITNKHVLEGSDLIIAFCHMKVDGGPSGELLRINITLDSNTVLMHPDPNVDLCAIFIGDFFHQMSDAGKEIFCIELTPHDIPPDEDWKYFDAMEEVTMLGCPNGIYDETNNLPIARRGITATLLSKPYNGKQEFVVDMACFPGSSGSPIFVYNRDGYLDRKESTFVMGQSRVKLVGILYAGPLVTNSGQIVMSQPTKVNVSSTMHLGYAIKSTAIFELQRLASSLP
jgi:hypothetical protein